MSEPSQALLVAMAQTAYGHDIHMGYQLARMRKVFELVERDVLKEFAGTNPLAVGGTPVENLEGLQS